MNSLFYLDFFFNLHCFFYLKVIFSSTKKKKKNLIVQNADTWEKNLFKIWFLLLDFQAY